jgi:glutamate 5-kinase
VKNARRVVVKLGTNALTDARGRLDVGFLNSFAAQVAGVVAAGVGVTVVSSGAVGAGMAELDLSERPKTLPMLQATAAVGQGQLMRRFYDAFESFGLKVAQILITRGDFEDRTRYLNIRNTIAALQECRAVPIINENDTVAVDELPGGEAGKFGDNDIIAALVTNMLRADLLVILSLLTVGGKLVEGVVKDGQVVELIRDARAGKGLDTGQRTALGTGGMGTKLTAAQMVSAVGEVAVVANARTPDVLPRILSGEKLGTLMVPAADKMSSKRRWIAQAARAGGKLSIDAGAAKALVEGGKSLLPSGITYVEGKFARGANLAILGPDGRQIARGLTNYSSDEIHKIKGLKSAQIAKALGDKPYDEVIHRNNMTLG